MFLSNPWLLGALVNGVLLTIGLFLPRKALTTAGLFHAFALGVLLWGCLGWQGYLVMMTYFLLGTGVTYVGKDIKEARGIAEKRSGARGPANLWGSAFVATVCAVGYVFFPHPLWQLGYVASVATKLADTMASEVGKAYGRTTYLITNLQLVPPGTEGAVSLEGTLAGILGAIVLALVGWLVGLISNPQELLLCVGAAFIATNLESVIGATLQSRWQWLTNEIVNAINTCLGATIAVGLRLLISR
ncbi:MAG: TIGR00297 family protein [Pseudanabaenaceae cyanobacterium SKYGB_i_bin29]|nr:TIGR00297 family protein [Pseudanabaenaceae cyanobacterium SKYG29]MDW8420726.1 TIGR00297 family protein [Pseudanabaenaceae cyanobacterium SKYGB_i_bin29]